jgi:tetratricopeptide (TPR) repeat protein
MRQRVLNIFIALGVALLAIGCSTDSGTMSLLLRAESIAQDSPEEALAVLDSVDFEKVRGKHDVARYQLIKSEVLYHNYIDSDSDTLTRGAVEFYVNSEYNHECARALYQHSLVLKRKGQNYLAEAMLALIEAKKRLEHVDDLRLKALVLRTEGDIYGAGCLFANALESYAAAKECFDQLGMEYHSASVLYDMGATYIQLRNFQSAQTALNEALEYGIRVDNKRFMCAVLHELLDLSIYMHDYDMCKTMLARFDTYDCLMYGESHKLSMEAMLLSYKGDKQGALELLSRAESAEDFEWADLQYARYIVYRNVGDGDNALRWEEKSRNAQDRLMIEVLEQPVLNVQIEMLQQSLDAAKREQSLVRQRNTLIYISIAIIVLFVGYVVLRRIRSKNRDIARYVETIKELSVALDSVPREMAASLSVLYRDRFSELNELCDIYYDHSGSSRHKSMVFNKLTDTIEAMKGDSERFEELERAVDEYRGGLMRRLKVLLPKLSERDYRVALYSFAGFSNRAISIFIDSDPVSVSKIKYNIKSKIKNFDNDDAAILVAALSEK